MRKMGNLINFLPFTYICLFIGSLSIMGFPFLTGFYSKDLLLELTYCRYIIDGFFIYYVVILTAFFTSVYSVKLLLVIFYIKKIYINLFLFQMNVLLNVYFYVFFIYFNNFCWIFFF